MKKRIVFITDCTDMAYSELRGAVFKELNILGSDIDLDIEPLVQVSHFSIINGSFILRLMAEGYPEGTIFSIILNPMKDRPARLVGKTKIKNLYFVGANTGVFDWFLNDFLIDELYEIYDPGFIAFGGKYVHASIVARIAAGEPLNSLGNKFDDGNLLGLPIPDGTILHIDNFGLIKFKGVLPKLNDGDKLKVSISGNIIPVVYSDRMMSKETGEWVIYRGSSFGLPEIGKVRQNGFEEFNYNIGDIVKVII